jgi:hypothetical protein
VNAGALLTALDLPAAAKVARRVPKSLLAEHGAETPADKRRIAEDLEQLDWIAVLKPETAGIPVYRDEAREILEIAVLRLALRGTSLISRIVELVHRAIPYPVLLIAERGPQIQLSAAHKRWSRSEEEAVVVDGEIEAVEWVEAEDEAYTAAFLQSLSLCRHAQGNLFALYQGWIDILRALRAARLTGVFAPPTSAEAARRRREALDECRLLDAEIVRLRAAAAREKQMSRQVELNLELKRVEAKRAAALARL